MAITDETLNQFVGYFDGYILMAITDINGHLSFPVNQCTAETRKGRGTSRSAPRAVNERFPCRTPARSGGPVPGAPACAEGWAWLGYDG